MDALPFSLQNSHNFFSLRPPSLYMPAMEQQKIRLRLDTKEEEAVDSGGKTNIAAAESIPFSLWEQHWQIYASVCVSLRVMFDLKNWVKGTEVPHKEDYVHFQGSEFVNVLQQAANMSMDEASRFCTALVIDFGITHHGNARKFSPDAEFRFTDENYQQLLTRLRHIYKPQNSIS